MSQIVKKFIGNAQVGATKIELENDSWMLGFAAGTGSVNIIKVDGSDIVQLNPNAQINSTPSNANDVANKSYVDTAVAGVTVTTAVKQAVRVLADSNLSLTGSATIDGVTLTNGQRVYANAQTTSTDNGIYVVNTSGAWSRSSDMANGSTFYGGTLIFVESGDQYGQKLYVRNSSANSVVGSGTVVIDGATFIVDRTVITLSGTDISNQYVDLGVKILANSESIFVNGVMQRWSTDYTLSTVGGVTRITFAGDLATGGAAALVSGDVLYIAYEY